MKKLSKVLSLVAFLTAISIASYAADFHFGVELGGVGSAGFSHSKATHKATYCEDDVCGTFNTDEKDPDDGTDSNLKEKDQIEKNRAGGVYFDMQLGADINVQDNINVTPYVDYGMVSEFSGASPSLMLGLGAMLFVKADEQLSYLAGLEGHSAAFGFRRVPENYFGNGFKNKEAIVTYGGSGMTLSGGILYKYFTVKALYISNSYKLEEFDTGDKFTDSWLTGQFPKDVATQSIGVSVGVKF